jgi:hypothetical protein
MTTLLDWLPSGIGILIALAASLIGLQVKLRRRRQLGERPPQPEKLLRPAGYSLQQKLENSHEELLFALLQLIGAAAVLGPALYLCAKVTAVFWRKLFNPMELLSVPHGYAVLLLPVATLALIAWAGWNLWRVFKLVEEGRSYHLGLRGEMATAEALHDHRLAIAGYTVFHDVPGDGAWNVDHLVVGPAGVFVIETKTRRRRTATRNQPDHKVTFDSHTLYLPWCEDHEAITQARRNANWVRQLTEPFSPKGLRVEPVVVLPGRWWVEALDKQHPNLAMNAKYLVNYLCAQPALYRHEQLHGILGCFAQRCRTVEF